MRSFGFISCVVAAVALQACAPDSASREAAFGEDARIGLNLEPSSKSMVVGEVITIMAKTENLLGRDAEIEWYAPGGDVQTEESGSIARVHFNEPGTYTVSARLFENGRQIVRDAVTINVRPLR